MTGTPSRSEWTVKTPANGVEITVETHKVFGWKVQRHLMPTGSQMVTTSTKTVARSRTPNRAMYVAGRCSVVNDGVALDDRVPGLYTQERPDHPAGTSFVTALEDTEFWCFNYYLNRNALPSLCPIRLATGETLQLSTGELLFVMKGTVGQLKGTMTFIPDADMELEVTSDLFAFVIAQGKE
ncbi:hypothetical protein [Acidovorax sp.]|uniref:hypothetical protein n=1 Tax=Acidovorax sp. TaxID=1872122 RepID=UPI00391FC575